MLMVAGAIAAATGAGFVGADITAKPAWIALIAGSGSAVAGGVGARTTMKRVRYRISAQWAGLWLTAIVSGAAALFWATGSAHLVPAGYLRRGILPLAAVAVVFYLSTSTRFSGDCYGLRFRRSHVAWRDISEVVFTRGAERGVFAIGARSASGARHDPMPVRAGELLTDLPYRTVVSQNKFDLSRLSWVLDQSGRPDIKLVERTSDGEQVRLDWGE